MSGVTQWAVVGMTRARQKRGANNIQLSDTKLTTFHQRRPEKIAVVVKKNGVGMTSYEVEATSSPTALIAPQISTMSRIQAQKGD